MAATLTINQSMVLTDTNLNVSNNPGQLSFSPATSQSSGSVFTVPTTASGVVIPLGSITVPGYFSVTNLDLTNYVQLLVAVSGAPFCKLLPGKTATFQFDPTLTAPAWVAHTGACKVSFLLCDGA